MQVFIFKNEYAVVLRYVRPWLSCAWPGPWPAAATRTQVLEAPRRQRSLTTHNDPVATNDAPRTLDLAPGGVDLDRHAATVRYNYI